MRFDIAYLYPWQPETTYT